MATVKTRPIADLSATTPEPDTSTEEQDRPDGATAPDEHVPNKQVQRWLNEGGLHLPDDD